MFMFGHNASPNYASQRAIDLANQIQISWRSGKFPVKWDFVLVADLIICIFRSVELWRE